MRHSPQQRKWFWFGGILAAVHTILFALVTVLLVISGPEAGMVYYIFVPLDYPFSRLYEFQGFGSPLGLMLIMGGFLWFLYGFLFQSLLSIRGRFGLLRFGSGVLLLGSFSLLPEMFLRSLPRWEENWQRGTAAAEAHDPDKAIRYVSEATRLSPPNNPILDGMWDYLGRLYMDHNDYVLAETAFTNALAAATTKPNSRPVDMLNAYNQLEWVYERAGNVQRRKECLQKAIELNRIVYKGDSTQEAGCWHNLAEIAHEAGDSAEARSLIEHAIALESGLPNRDSWSLNYMNDQLKKWTAN